MKDNIRYILGDEKLLDDIKELMKDMAFTREKLNWYRSSDKSTAED